MHCSGVSLYLSGSFHLHLAFLLATQTVHPDVAKMAAAAAAAAQAPISRAPAPAPNPYVLDPKDHPQIAQRAPIPEQIGRGGMVLGPRDANGGYMVIFFCSEF